MGRGEMAWQEGLRWSGRGDPDWRVTDRAGSGLNMVALGGLGTPGSSVSSPVLPGGLEVGQQIGGVLPAAALEELQEP